jgi:hypothetical protein
MRRASMTLDGLMKSQFQNQGFKDNKNWDELINRNEKLAIEVGRLRGEIGHLKKETSKLLVWKLQDQINRKVSRGHDKSCQTDLPLVNNYTSPSTINNHIYRTPNTLEITRNIFGVVDEMSAEKEIKKDQDEQKKRATGKKKGVRFQEKESDQTPKAISPANFKVEQELQQRIQLEATSNLQTPVKNTSRRFSENDFHEDETSTYLPRRTVRKPVTYKEPSLRVKVRKGFEFFSFGTPHPHKGNKKKNYSDDFADEQIDNPDQT